MTKQRSSWFIEWLDYTSPSGDNGYWVRDSQKHSRVVEEGKTEKKVLKKWGNLGGGEHGGLRQRSDEISDP